MCKARIPDTGVMKCSVCGKKPCLTTYDVNSGCMYCTGYGIHRHRKIKAGIDYAQPSDLFLELTRKWNDMHFKKARFLFYTNGSPFRKDINDNK